MTGCIFTVSVTGYVTYIVQNMTYCIEELTISGFITQTEPYCRNISRFWFRQSSRAERANLKLKLGLSSET